MPELGFNQHPEPPGICSLGSHKAAVKLYYNLANLRELPAQYRIKLQLQFCKQFLSLWQLYKTLAAKFTQAIWDGWNLALRSLPSLAQSEIFWVGLETFQKEKKKNTPQLLRIPPACYIPVLERQGKKYWSKPETSLMLQMGGINLLDDCSSLIFWNMQSQVPYRWRINCLSILPVFISVPTENQQAGRVQRPHIQLWLLQEHSLYNPMCASH